MFDRGKQPEYEMDLENRFVAPEVTENDRDNELSLRPHTLEEYIGQEQVKENLSVFMQAARLRGEPLDHVLLYGPPGLGKTTLAEIIANEMDVNLKITSGPAIEKPGDMAAILNNLQDGDLLFVDEIHTMIGAGGAEGAGCGKRAGNCRLCVSVYRKSVCMGRYEPHKRSGLFRIRTVGICTFWNRTSAYDMGYGECGNGGKLRSGCCGRHYLI